jgi:predicted MFS family arabinose efflux permease
MPQVADVAAHDADDAPLDVVEIDAQRPGAPPGAEGRNFWLLVGQQMLFRIGWLFKTESTVMPYVLDQIGGGPVVRGWLMVLNRLGASIPPALYARRLKLMKQKRWSLMATTAGGAMPFAVMSLLWGSGACHDATGTPHDWVRYVFLGCYGWFFVVTGLNQLSVQTVHGKLVPAERRGGLFTTGVVLGTPLAALCGLTLLPAWLALPGGGFEWIFAMTALALVLSGLTMLGVRELDDHFEEPPRSAGKRIEQALRIARRDPRLRRVAIVAVLYSVAFTLFPHYTALAREATAATFKPTSIATWTVTQHLAVALVSLVAGPVADRFGARRSVQLTVLGSAMAPILALALTLAGEAGGAAGLFWLVYVPLGFTPVTNKMLLNYTLELAPREDHALYTSAIGLCLALPVIAGSLLVGYLIQSLGPTPVFALGAAVMLAAWVGSWRLFETRGPETDLGPAQPI